ncbi:DNA-binding transcriptional LysR family regulator [Lacrimispora xylanisolvens]|uniref:DNA-binding transcriptional LysR family regulator n=1 Tax=Lacrimispora xylanisolvens TaxID=384636 RepID=A0A2S6HZ01_9FIRM|nr:LysR family transcriptional regulator [Hungatella xylanolytica]PPK83391.1 DNA-binding transcriptional LysR family regulator [Hungatella xylanolytica]
MEINDITIFMELYRNRSITKTAELLNYTQSNVSARLMKLEKEFHGTFFLRTRSGLKILPEGERFYQYAVIMEDTLKKLYQEFQTESQEIRVGSTQLLSRLYFPWLFEKSSYFTMHTDAVKKLNRNFNSQIYDIVITHMPQSPDTGIFQIQYPEVLLWAASSSLDWNQEEVLPVIVSRDKLCPLRHLTLQTLSQGKIQLSLIEVDTLDLMITLLSANRAIALLPEKLIKQERRLKVLPSLSPVTLPVYGYCRKKTEADLLNQLFQET